MRLDKSDFGEKELLMIAGVGLLAYVFVKGGWANAGAAAGGAIVDAAGGIISGSVDSIGQGVGLPPLAMITKDPAVARYIMDQPSGGWFTASKYSSAAAFANAQFLTPGSGYPPPANSPLASIFPTLVGPPYDPSQDGLYSDWDDFSNPHLGL